MCWRKSNTKSAFTEELNSKNSEISTLTIKVEELNKNSANNLLEIDRLKDKHLELNVTNSKLVSKLNEITHELEQYKVVNEALTDKVNEFNTDNHDKQNLIDEMTKRYNLELDKLNILIKTHQSINEQIEVKNKELEDQLYTIRKEEVTKNIVIYYFVGYNYNKDKIDLEYDVKKFMDNKISEVHIEFDNSMYNALENMKIGKNLHKIRNTKKIVKDAYDNILGDLNNGKKIILIGENYGGAIVNRLLDMFIQDFKKITNLSNLSNLYCFIFGSFYSPERHQIQKHLQKYISSDHVFNYIFDNDISSKYDVGEIPPNTDKDSWTMNPKTFLRWKLTDSKDTDNIMNSYDVLPSVKRTITKLGII
tara:strand:+ start:2671 stop:3762 length:1092 start_codon:yes stop_codon:yes gene_type:complete